MFRLGYQNNIGIVTDCENKNTLTTIILYETILEPICFTELSKHYFLLNAQLTEMTIEEWSIKIVDFICKYGSQPNALNYLINHIKDKELTDRLQAEYENILKKAKCKMNALYKKYK